MSHYFISLKVLLVHILSFSTPVEARPFAVPQLAESSLTDTVQTSGG